MYTIKEGGQLSGAAPAERIFLDSLVYSSLVYLPA